VAAGRADGDRTDGEHGLVALTPFPRKVDSPSRRPDVFKRAARLALVSCSRMRQFGNGAVTAQATGSRARGTFLNKRPCAEGPAAWRCSP
jgi:hypothetical protein